MQSMIASNLHFVYVRALFQLAYQAFLLMVSTVIITLEFFTNLIELHWGFFSLSRRSYTLLIQHSMVLYFLLKKFPPVECLQEYVHVRITAIEDCINFIVTRWKWIKYFDAKHQLEFYTICNVTADLILLVQDF